MAQYDPASQGVQLSALPVVVSYAPVGHEVQAAAPAAEKVPEEHRLEHAVLRPVEGS